MDQQGTRRLGEVARLPGTSKPVGGSTQRTIQRLASAPNDLLINPRIGEKLEEFSPREVRRILVGHYEMRYEIQASTIYMLRLWHTREDR